MQEQGLWRNDSGNKEEGKEMSTIHELEQRIKVLESLLGRGVDHLEVDENGYLKISDVHFVNDTLELVNPEIDATKANNNVSSIKYPTTGNILDKNGKILSRTEGVVEPSGKVGFNIYANNYNSSGIQVGNARITGYVAKDGTVSYVVTAPDKFRQAIGLSNNFNIARLVSATINRAYGGYVSITAPTISGYTFVCWAAVATDGWVGSCYVENPLAVTTNIWNASTGQGGSGLVHATALYRLNT